MKATPQDTAPARSKRMTQEQRKRQIIEVTLNLIEREGIEGATTARIASGSGITEPTLYRNFGSRRGILLAVLAVVYGQIETIFDSPKHPDAVVRLREIGALHTARLLSRKRGFTVPFNEFLMSPARLGLRQEVQKFNTAIVSRLVAIIEEGKTQGTIRPDVDANEVAWQIVGIHWFENIAYLSGVKNIVLKGPSTKSLECVLKEIAAQPDPS